MEILNIGPLELFFILLIAFIVLGPEETIKAGRKFGKLISRLVKSETWASVLAASREIRKIPRKMIDDSDVEETLADISRDVGRVTNDLNTNFRNIPTVSPSSNETQRNNDQTDTTIISKQKRQ